MATYVALLYSVIIDRKRRVAMADLRRVAEKLGFGNTRTLVSTGNLIFEADDQPVSDIEAALEAAFAAFHGKHVDIIIRNADRWRVLIAANPFPDESASTPDRVVVRVMRQRAEEQVLDRCRRVQANGEQVCLVDGDLWIAFAGKPSESKLPGVLAPGRMGGIGTTRNWNTVRRLGEMLDSRC
ncbi:DUF1697 domain-containing protein [Rhizobium sp. KVB221]|uniref:DUF1697 domain-containing protein n=1 Tax=Rhizobium setariae TaxID=2801340 RepID=A0A936YMB7_9HYPH|nr:DUF1697 domain-containing protein [Rhizobium setariae]MBL0373033.1 DUF1697 domain-containing protein [Rhizobium setariae]